MRNAEKKIMVRKEVEEKIASLAKIFSDKVKEIGEENGVDFTVKTIIEARKK